MNKHLATQKTNNHPSTLETIETIALDAVTGGCASCGSGQPDQAAAQQQPAQQQPAQQQPAQQQPALQQLASSWLRVRRRPAPRTPLGTTALHRARRPTD